MAVRCSVEAVDMERSPRAEKTNYHVRLEYDGDVQDQGFQDIAEDDGEPNACHACHACHANSGGAADATSVCTEVLAFEFDVPAGK
jgi:hypothetical protein